MNNILRNDGRAFDQMRPLKITPHASRFAEGSCWVEYGLTKLLITASCEENVPPFLKKSGRGWLTAEYGMLPRSTDKRLDRARTLEDGRVKEIQRLIGRSLRAALDFTAMGERQIKIDCDVIEADGGTRTAAITGGWVALHLACQHMVKAELVHKLPIKHQIMAVSVGIIAQQPMLDLNYAEDSRADTDANFVMTADGRLIEVQAGAEQEPFSIDEMNRLINLAQGAKSLICAEQSRAISA